MLIECDEVLYFRHIEQRLALRTSLDLVDPQQLRSFTAYAIALRLSDACFSIVGKGYPAFAIDCHNDDLIHNIANFLQ